MNRPPATHAAFVRGAFLLAACFLVVGCSEQPTVAFVQPQRQNLTSSITTNGQVEAGDRSEIFAPTTGLVVEVFVKEGQRVRRRQRLLTIDDRTARQELDQAQARREAATAELAGIESGGNPSEIADLETQLENARQSKAKLEEDVQALERLVAKQAAPRTELDEARRRVEENSRKITLLERKLAVRFSTSQREAAMARVREADAAVALAKQKVGSAVVESPADGVLYSLPVRSGAFVTAGTLVARIGNAGEVDVLIYVDEPEVGRVKLGAPVRITSDAYPGKHWECKIDRLPAEIVALETRRVGKVYCSVGNAEELIPNLLVSIEIESASAQNVLTLPREAVFREQGESAIWVINDKQQAERRKVEPGIADANRVEIRSGVNESDRVLLPGQLALSEGQTVRLAEQPH